ncbi:MAG: hypothetical protein MUF73_09125 [Rhodobacteraceae bacterium]|jgi:F0F1-type ATP synthase membrane subunit c/vacuolar-type H+-ATPase subunit K|nr:hypothetical protein [Paracoccaceae bacterium]
MSTTGKPIARRQLLARIGLAAGAAYVAPSLTTLGMARASGASGGSGASAVSRQSSPSRQSRQSGPSRQSRASRPSGPGRGDWTGSQQVGEVPVWVRRMLGG